MNTVTQAIADNMQPLNYMYPTRMHELEYKAYKARKERAEREHAPNIAVRMNSRYQMEYYNTNTGEIVSEHH